MEKQTDIILYSVKKERELQKEKSKDMALLLGITQAGYSLLESGKRKISLDNLVKICDRLGIEIVLNKKLN